MSIMSSSFTYTILSWSMNHMTMIGYIPGLPTYCFMYSNCGMSDLMFMVFPRWTFVSTIRNLPLTKQKKSQGFTELEYPLIWSGSL